MKKMVAIVGPTGTGKTGLALSILNDLTGEIISADSRQVYVGLDYLTNKLSPNEDHPQKHEGFWIQDTVRINMYDLVSVTDGYNVDSFVTGSMKHLNRIWADGGLPLLVGGTGFYIDSLLGSSPYGSVAPNTDLRLSLVHLTVDDLVARLTQLDSTCVANLLNDERQNRQRLIRYIEIATACGSVVDGIQTSPLTSQINNQEVEVLYIGLTSSRELLYEKADRWVERLVASPQYEQEVVFLASEQSINPTLARGLLISEALQHKQGDVTAEEVSVLMKGRLHRYIRTQLKWFRRNDGIYWYDISDTNFVADAKEHIQKWYDVKE